MITVDLKSFLSTGRFGNIDLGMTKAQIERFVGKPDYWMMTHFANNQKENSPIWRYGNIEFHFNSNCELTSIYNDHLLEAGLFGGPQIKLDCWVLLKEKQKLKSIEKHLDNECFYYSKELVVLQELPQIKLSLQSGVDLFFTSEIEEDNNYISIKKESDFLLSGFEIRQNLFSYDNDEDFSSGFSLQ